MPYKKVTRCITVEFVRHPRGKGFDVRMTPETVVARYGDTIVWDVQGLPAGLATSVSFGDFEAIETVARVTHGSGGLHRPAVQRLGGIMAQVAPPRKSVKASRRRYLAELPLGLMEPGYYKYNIKFGKDTIVDPDVEIRGPRN